MVMVLNACHPHFIRCVKPNMVKKADVFDDDMILQQLRYSGLLETVRIRQSGYPVRRTFGDFMKRYGVLMTKKAGAADSANIEAFLKAQKDVAASAWQVGKTRIFYREAMEIALEK